MHVKISDTAPGSGPARSSYLESRLLRVFAQYASRIEVAELNLEFDGFLYEGELVVRIAGAAPLMFTNKGRRVTNVLAELIDAGAQRVSSSFPKARGREEAS